MRCHLRLGCPLVEVQLVLTCLSAQDRPGLVVLVIELENALASMQHNVHTTVLWSPYREPLAKFLNKYTAEVSSALRLVCEGIWGVVAMMRRPGLLARSKVSHMSVLNRLQGLTIRG